MKLSKLIAKLAAFQQAYQQSGDPEVMICTGIIGTGPPREITIGPKFQIITDMDRDTPDCEKMEIGQAVIVIGFRGDQ